ncbi:MAG TPA: ATP-binding protein [Burkholderiales bacterium]|nr:ATP-binding protein [Burkholderiales bacterium]
MNSVDSARPLQWEVDRSPASGEIPERYWRPLFFFNIYRLIVALLLLLVVTIWGNTIWFGSYDMALFVVTDIAYVLFSIGCFVLISARWQFNLLLTGQVTADIGFLVILMFASSGISSGLGLLLLTTLAGAGLISRGRLTLFFAALAAIAVLLEHTYEVLRFDASVAQYVQAGLLSGGYFATAWLAHTLAKYTQASEQLAAQRGIDLVNMAQVNQLVIRDMQDGVLVVDEKGVIRLFNARAERLLGPMSQEREEPMLAEYAPALAARFEVWRQQNDGGADVRPTFGQNMAARFVPIGGNRHLGAVIFLEDQSRVQAQARQMKLAAVGRLTANIAHEIRNPLGAISHAAELMHEEPAINDTTRRLLTIIHENSQRLDRMVNDVLRLNRGERAQHERFQLVDFLKTFIEQFAQVEKVDPAIFSIELDAEPEVLFDRSHLNQVMWNLCRNALRHSRREPASIRIRVGLERWAGVVKLDVLDDGPGIAVELRSQLFEPFFTTAAGGTGLGLYIAREICDANGATLDFVETPSGAQFTVQCRAA